MFTTRVDFRLKTQVYFLSTATRQGCGAFGMYKGIAYLARLVTLIRKFFFLENRRKRKSFPKEVAELNITSEKWLMHHTILVAFELCFAVLLFSNIRFLCPHCIFPIHISSTH